jgi:hypothetical protein
MVYDEDLILHYIVNIKPDEYPIRFFIYLSYR